MLSSFSTDVFFSFLKNLTYKRSKKINVKQFKLRVAVFFFLLIHCVMVVKCTLAFELLGFLNRLNIFNLHNKHFRELSYDWWLTRVESEMLNNAFTDSLNLTFHETVVRKLNLVMR